MKMKVLSNKGDYFRARFENNDGEYLFTVEITGSLLSKWGLNQAQWHVPALHRLGEEISKQSSTSDNDEEIYIFDTYNSQDTLEKTLENFPF